MFYNSWPVVLDAYVIKEIVYDSGLRDNDLVFVSQHILLYFINIETIEHTSKLTSRITPSQDGAVIR